MAVLTLNTRVAQLFEMQATAIELLRMKFVQLVEEDKEDTFTRIFPQAKILEVKMAAAASWARYTGDPVTASLCEDIGKGLHRARLMAKEIYPGEYYGYVVEMFMDIMAEAIIEG